MPISPVRVATAAYIVIVAPIIAPSEKMIESDIPSSVMKFDRLRRLVLVELPSHA